MADKSSFEIPPELQDRIAMLRAPLPGVRWIDAEDLHLTLRFAGDIDNRTADELADRLAAIDISTFEMRLSGLGAFGGRDPRNLWVDVEAGPELEALARANERAARAAGLPPETRQFKPHVTFARLRNSRDEVLARYLERNGAFRSEPFRVTRFVLFSSKPQVGGGPYVVEEAFPLRGASLYDTHDAGVW